MNEPKILGRSDCNYTLRLGRSVESGASYNRTNYDQYVCETWYEETWYMHCFSTKTEPGFSDKGRGEDRCSKLHGGGGKVGYGVKKPKYTEQGN